MLFYNEVRGSFSWYLKDIEHVARVLTTHRAALDTNGPVGMWSLSVTRASQSVKIAFGSISFQIRWCGSRSEIRSLRMALMPAVCSGLGLSTPFNEKVADDNTIWILWNTAPGGKSAFFNVDKNWLPIYHFTKCR